MTKITLVMASAALLLRPQPLSLSEPRQAPRVEHRLARWPEGRPRLETTIVDEAYHGEYRTWYRSGAPYELRHFVHGREQGQQQSWTETGELFLNYEVRQGRRYGLINATPCLPVDEGHR